jgi:glutamyl-tRNA reductase
MHRWEAWAVSRHVEIDDGLWEEFHRVVNMSSRELLEWLRTRSADEQSEELPDQAGTETGQRVLQILKKRRVDLTADDESVMRKVVNRVRAERRSDLESTAGQSHWRHRLMTIRHDPLKEPD